MPWKDKLSSSKLRAAGALSLQLSGAHAERSTYWNEMKAYAPEKSTQKRLHVSDLFKFEAGHHKIGEQGHKPRSL